MSKLRGFREQKWYSISVVFQSLCNSKFKFPSSKSCFPDFRRCLNYIGQDSGGELKRPVTQISKQTKTLESKLNGTRLNTFRVDHKMCNSVASKNDC